MRLYLTILQQNTWMVWAAVIGIAAFAIIAEQKWKWAQFLSSVIVAIFGTMILASIGIMPAKSPVYSAVNGYILPLAIPLLLFKCDIRKIIKESGSLFLIVNVAALGTCIGAFVSGCIFSKTPHIDGIVAMQVGAYVGGTVNLVAMGKVPEFHMDDSYIGAASVVVNMFVVLVLLLYSFMTVSKWFRRHYIHPHIDAFESGVRTNTGASPSEQYWKPKPISLRGLAVTLTTALAIAAFSNVFCNYITWDTSVNDTLKMLLGNMFLVIPTITIVLVTTFPKYFNNLAGAEELGTLMIMLFFVALGCAADIGKFVTIGPVFIITSIIILFFNLGLILLVGKLLKWPLEDIITCSNATIGGPPTAAGLAVNKGWSTLVVPGLLIGLYGYAIGNYCGVLIASLL
jgi:uncharacterized membrane protein